MKIVNGWLFTNQLWRDAGPTPVAIKLDNIQFIGESFNDKIGIHTQIGMNSHAIAIEGETAEVISELYNHMSNN